MQWIKHVVLAGVIVLAPLAGHAQDIPKCPIRIIVSGAAGGAPDLIARTEADILTTALGNSAFVENKIGGLGAITSIQAAKSSEPNGCTLLAANAAIFSIVPAMYSKPPYSMNEFAPVSAVATAANLLVVNPEVPARTLSELIDLLKADPDKYIYAFGGIGTPMHLYAELVRSRTGRKITHVSYKGSPQAIVDVIAGRAHFIFDPIPSLLPHVLAGTLRPIAVASARRSELLPDVPTLKEAGIPDADAVSWYGLVAPVGTPAPVREAYAAILRKGIKDPKVVERLKKFGAETLETTPDQMLTFAEDQRKAWEPLVRASGTKLD